jgi:hypothetical protein
VGGYGEVGGPKGSSRGQVECLPGGITYAH